jgi:hypothetical protein
LKQSLYSYDRYGRELETRRRKQPKDVKNEMKQDTEDSKISDNKKQEAKQKNYLNEYASDNSTRCKEQSIIIKNIFVKQHDPKEEQEDNGEENSYW